MKEFEKQAIEEMENDLRECHSEFEADGDIYTDYPKTAERMIDKGWRKQNEGAWIEVEDTFLYRYKCSLCGEIKLGKMTNFCPNCGAKMKGD